MAPKKKSSFYHLRQNQLGINQATAAEITGTDTETIQQWDDNGAPIYVERLLRLWDCKRIGVQGWDGWIFSRGVLKFKKRQWRPENIINDRVFREKLELEASQLLNTLKSHREP